MISQLFRDIAANRPGRLSTVEPDTLVAPRNAGGKLNARTTEDLVRLISLNGVDCLPYKTFPVDVAIVRGTTADADGNVTMVKEALALESLAIAMPRGHSRGIVIVQIERIRQANSAVATKLAGDLVVSEPVVR
ncbi:acyl CoA:acetate/3-ketoacid CoA transferase [Paraburkholderia atlantica]